MAVRRGEQGGPPLEDLVEAVARGDREAFGRLYLDWGPRIRAFLARGCRDPQRCEDLTQEVLLQVWRSAHRYDRRRAKASTWLFTVARNVAIDALRKERVFEHHDEEGVSVDPLPDDRAADRQSAERLHAAVAELPAEQKAVLIAAWWDDRALPEVAAEAGVPLGTVKSRVRLALDRLRGWLGGTP